MLRRLLALLLPVLLLFGAGPGAERYEANGRESAALDQNLQGRLRMWATAISLCGAPTERLRLLESSYVADDLQLSARQLEAVEKIAQAATATLLAAIDNATADPALAMDPQVHQQRRNLEAFLDRFETVSTDRLLSPTQNARLRQLYWQSRGVEALVADEVAKVLALTPAQRQELARRHKELHVLYQGGGKAAQLALPGMTKDGHDGQRLHDAWQRLNRQ